MKADTAQSSAESDVLTQKLQRMRAHDARRATADTHDRQLKIWGADDADNPVNGDSAVSIGDVDSDASVVDCGNNVTDHVNRHHLKIWGADEADNPVNNGYDASVDASRVKNVAYHINRHHLKIWGADDADNPVTGDYYVSSSGGVSDASFVGFGS